MKSNGFSEVDCRGAFASRLEIIQWRDKACTAAANPDERMHELIEEKFGARPAVFCGMAELAIGQWHQSLREGN